MTVKHEITLVAYVTDSEGFLSIADIVETIRHFAPRFATRFIRNGDFSHIAALSPGQPLSLAILRKL